MYFELNLNLYIQNDFTTENRQCVKIGTSTFSKKKRKTTDFSLCIFCQEKKKSPLVVPKTYEKALQCIEKRAEWDEIEYVTILYELNKFSNVNLQNEHAKWHSECYKKCTHKANMERSERLYQKRLLEPSPSTSESVETPRNYILRSKTLVYDKESVFFATKRVRNGISYVLWLLFQQEFV